MAFSTPAYMPQQGFSFQQNQGQFSGNQLNPSVPRFLPTGTELQRYSVPDPTPPSSIMSSPASGDMQRFIAETHMKHTYDITQVEHRARQTSDELKMVKNMIGTDFRALESKIEQLEMQVNQKRSPSPQMKLADGQIALFEPRGPQTEAMLQRFEPESVAAIYREQAEIYEEVALSLRKDADQITGNSTVREPKTPKPLQTSSAAVNGTGYKHNAVVNGDGDVHTPAHMPPRKASRALEIKAPVGEQTLQETQVDAPQPGNNHRAQALGDVEGNIQASKNVSTTPNEGIWQPLAVRQMPPTTVSNITNTETFTWEFIHTTLGGEQWSPGFYFIARNSILPGKAYWSLEAEWEPFLPTAPGQHGAKLTAFFNTTLSQAGEAPDEENYKDTPVFISQDGGKTYTYFGHYSQLRFSDKLDYDRMMEAVPERIRQYWAEQLAAQGRPEWVTTELMHHFWPKLTYEGPMPTDSAVNTPATMASGTSAACEKRVTRALEDYGRELKDWEKDASMKVKLLQSETLMKAFEKPDADEEPGLRLWYEYLQCVGYDQEFYEMLVQLKSLPDAKRAVAAMSKTVSKAQPAPGKEVSIAKRGDSTKPARDMSVAVTGSTSQTVMPPKAVPTFKGGSKPREKPSAAPKNAAQQKVEPPTMRLNGDLAVAKQLKAEFENGGRSHTKRGGGGKGRGEDGLYVAPHTRAKK